MMEQRKMDLTISAAIVTVTNKWTRKNITMGWLNAQKFHIHMYVCRCILFTWTIFVFLHLPSVFVKGPHSYHLDRKPTKVVFTQSCFRTFMNKWLHESGVVQADPLCWHPVRGGGISYVRAKARYSKKYGIRNKKRQNTTNATIWCVHCVLSGHKNTALGVVVVVAASTLHIRA